MFFASSNQFEEEKKMTKEEKMKREDLSRIVNLVGAEEVMCYDRETGKCSSLENLEALSREGEGKVWIFPYDMELCSKNKALRWYSEEYNINIPDGCNRWCYLREEGLDQPFYDYLSDIRLKAMEDWLCKHCISQLNFDD